MQDLDMTSSLTQGGIHIRNQMFRAPAVALAVLAVCAPAAQAKKKTTTTTTSTTATAPAPAPGTCPGQSFSTIFAGFSDDGLYTLVPNGDFEAGTAGWTLGGGVTVVADQSGLKLGGTTGRSSLELPAGAQVTSAPVCAAKAYKSFRFAARSVTGGRAGLGVEVLYADGKVKSAGSLSPAKTWTPTPVLKLSQGSLGLGEDGTAMVRFRFTASTAAVRVDDVYIDPRLRF
jgi:hypothetical protein